MTGNSLPHKVLFGSSNNKNVQTSRSQGRKIFPSVLCLYWNHELGPNLLEQDLFPREPKDPKEDAPGAPGALSLKKRERESRGGTDKEGDTESEGGSRL